jgi:zinc protease
LLGIEEQKDQKQYYKVQINKGADKKDIEFYDVLTGLKIRSESKQGTAEYADYKAVDGILFPFSLKQTMGPQSFNLTVTEIKVNSGLKDDLFEVK